MEILLLDLGFDFCSENEGTEALVSGLHGALAVDCPAFALGSSVQGPRQVCRVVAQVGDTLVPSICRVFSEHSSFVLFSCLLLFLSPPQC